MKYEFTAILEYGDDGWWAASCPEVPGANGQGRTPDEAREDLASCIEFVFEYLRDEALKDMAPGARREMVTVG